MCYQMSWKCKYIDEAEEAPSISSISVYLLKHICTLDLYTRYFLEFLTTPVLLYSIQCWWESCTYFTLWTTALLCQQVQAIFLPCCHETYIVKINLCSESFTSESIHSYIYIHFIHRYMLCGPSRKLYEWDPEISSGLAQALITCVYIGLQRSKCRSEWMVEWRAKCLQATHKEVDGERLVKKMKEIEKGQGRGSWRKRNGMQANEWGRSKSIDTELVR